MIFTYRNSRGKSITFNDYPFIMKDNNLVDYAYKYDEIEGKNRIENVRLDAGKRKMRILVMPNPQAPISSRISEVKKLADELFELFDYDVANGVNGQMWTDNGYYLPCQVLSSNKDKMLGVGALFLDFEVVSDKNTWIKPVTKTFVSTPIDPQAENQDYPYDYPYDYCASQTGVAYWNLNHYKTSNAIITIYGAAVNPQITINGHHYIVYTTVADNEKLVIDTAIHQVYLLGVQGQRVNVYDLRGKEESVFSPLPALPLTISWSGAFRFDITALIERTEPKWN